MKIAAKLFACLCLAVGAMGLAAGAQAQTTYTYTGAVYSSTVDFTPACGVGSCANFPPAGSISGSFTTALPLAPGLAGTNIASLITTYSFSDGINTYAPGANDRLYAFQITTDGAGAITGTTIVMEKWATVSHGGGDRLGFANIFTGSALARHNIACSVVGVGDDGTMDTCTLPSGGADTDVSESTAPPGSWVAFTAPPAAVPTVGEWALMLIGLLLAAMSMFLLERRRALSVLR